MKKVLSVLFALVIAVSAFAPINALADEAKEYSLKYDMTSNQWRVQEGASWDEAALKYSIDYLSTVLKDGDSLTVFGTDKADVTNLFSIGKKLDSLTLESVQNIEKINFEKKVNNIYLKGDTVVALSGSYERIYIYDSSYGIVCNDVDELYLVGETVMNMGVTTEGYVKLFQVIKNGTVTVSMTDASPFSLSIVHQDPTYNENGTHPNNETEPFITPVFGGGDSNSSKINNTLNVKGKTVKVDYLKLKKKTKKFKVKKTIKFIDKGQGTLSYKKIKGNKKIVVNKKTGKIAVKKGLKKGTYKVKVQVTAAGNAKYNSAQRTVTIKVKVK